MISEMAELINSQFHDDTFKGTELVVLQSVGWNLS